MKMRPTLRAFLLAACAGITSAHGSDPADNRLWSAGTAFLLPEGRREVGIFQSYRTGISESVELSIHPLAFFVIPNFQIKWSHGNYKGFRIASRHAVVYPTLLLRGVARKKIGGLISPEFHIPHMVSIYNEALLSRSFSTGFLFTGRAGLDLALRSGGLDDRTTIDLPFIFPRLNVYYNGYGFRFGAGLRGSLVRRWQFKMDGDTFHYPGAEQAFAFEQKGSLLWTKSRRFQAGIGYALSYCEYPFGAQWHLVGPLLDLVWGWQAE